MPVKWMFQPIGLFFRSVIAVFRGNGVTPAGRYFMVCRYGQHCVYGKIKKGERTGTEIVTSQKSVLWFYLHPFFTDRVHSIV